jgi:succinate dehydrogenase / fumarate reductase, cytochrome b subunit
MPERPLSPFLSVYKFKYTLVTSILNRFAGLVLSVGLLLLVYWLVALANGARAYAQARTVLALPIFKLVYVVLVAAFVYHLVAGVRHLVWDCGLGLGRETARRSAWTVAAVSVVITVILIWCLMGPGTYGR